jgi:hypothetical protein
MQIEFDNYCLSPDENSVLAQEASETKDSASPELTFQAGERLFMGCPKPEAAWLYITPPIGSAKPSCYFYAYS